MFYNSRYNFCFETESCHLLYNSKSGATVKLNGEDAVILGEYLIGAKRQVDPDLFDIDLFRYLAASGFIVDASVDELLDIRERYWKARGETPVVLTITTTMNCNLGCYYCYEERTEKKLEFKDADSIIQKLETLFSQSNKKSLHVDWYGGEPLLNIEFMESASLLIQEFCQKKGINYHSSIISNGTLWPQQIESFLKRHKIRQVQISFDGLKENHNARRRYRKEFLSGENNSYDLTFSLVEKLLDFVTVDIRFNIDWRNKDDIFPFLDIISERGWFDKMYPAIFQPARLSAYSERSAFMSKKQLSIKDFDLIREKISKKLAGIGKIEESEVPDGFPFPKTFVCAALATDSFVVGADQLIYRCGLQVGETNRATQSLQTDSNHHFSDNGFWDTFDPTISSSCSKCSFLPVCFGGCPKKHLEGDQSALDEQSEYWKNNLAQKVVTYFGLETLSKVPLTKELQFREGY